MEHAPRTTSFLIRIRQLPNNLPPQFSTISLVFKPLHFILSQALDYVLDSLMFSFAPTWSLTRLDLETIRQFALAGNCCAIWNVRADEVEEFGALVLFVESVVER